MDEADILDNSFSLIFAFDEIVALGYRESVNLAQIRTFVEMDSHEEKVEYESFVINYESFCLQRWKLSLSNMKVLSLKIKVCEEFC